MAGILYGLRYFHVLYRPLLVSSSDVICVSHSQMNSIMLPTTTLLVECALVRAGVELSNRHKSVAGAVQRLDLLMRCECNIHDSVR